MQRDDKQDAHDPGVGSLIVARYTSTSSTIS